MKRYCILILMIVILSGCGSTDTQIIENFIDVSPKKTDGLVLNISEYEAEIFDFAKSLRFDSLDVKILKGTDSTQIWFKEPINQSDQQQVAYWSLSPNHTNCENRQMTKPNQIVFPNGLTIYGGISYSQYDDSLQSHVNRWLNWKYN